MLKTELFLKKSLTKLYNEKSDIEFIRYILAVINKCLKMWVGNLFDNSLTALLLEIKTTPPILII